MALVLEITVDASGVVTGLRQVTTAHQQFEQQVSGTTPRLQHASQAADRMATGLGNMAKQLAIAGTAFLGFQGITGAVNTVTGSIIGLDKELANVNTVLTGSGKSINALHQEILRLPPSLGSATELTKGMYQALSAGIEPAKVVGFVAEQAKLASAGISDMSTTIKATTAAMDAYNIGAENSSRISDAFFTIVQRGKTEFDPLANSIANVFPLTKNLNISFEETAATVTTLTRVFPSVSEAVTGFRSLLSGVISNMDNFRAAGINVQEVIGKRGVTGLLEELQRVTGGSAEVLRAKFIPDIEGTNAALALMGPQLQAQKDNVQAFTNTVGANATAFAKQQESISASLERIKVSFERIAQGAGLEPLFRGLLEPIEAWLTRLQAGGQASVEFAEIATTALGAVVSSTGLLAQISIAVIEGWNRIGQGIGSVATLYFNALEGMTRAARKLGLVSQEQAEQSLVTLAKMSMPFRKFTIDMGSAADQWGKTRESIAEGQAAIEASVTKAGQRAKQFATEVHGAGDASATAAKEITAAGTAALNVVDAATTKTAEAVRKSAEIADAANQSISQSTTKAGAEVVQSTKQVTEELKKIPGQVLSGTITVWRDGKQQIIQVFEEIKTGSEASGKGVEEAFVRAGISTRETLQNTAKESLDVFKRILDSGKATPQQLLDLWQKNLKQLTDAGFKQLPPEWQAINNQMQEIARKAGVELPKPYKTASGEIVADLKKVPSAFDQELTSTIKAVTEAIALHGRDFRKYLTDAQIASAEKFDLIKREAKETGEALKEGLGGGAEQGAERTKRALTDIELSAQRTAQVLSVVFEEKFADTMIGVTAQLERARRELTQIQAGPEPIGTRGFKAATTQTLREEIELLERRLKGLQDQDKETKAQLDTPVKKAPTSVGQLLGMTGGTALDLTGRRLTEKEGGRQDIQAGLGPDRQAADRLEREIQALMLQDKEGRQSIEAQRRALEQQRKEAMTADSGDQARILQDAEARLRDLDTQTVARERETLARRKELEAQKKEALRADTAGTQAALEQFEARMQALDAQTVARERETSAERKRLQDAKNAALKDGSAAALQEAEALEGQIQALDVATLAAKRDDAAARKALEAEKQEALATAGIDGVRAAEQIESAIQDLDVTAREAKRQDAEERVAIEKAKQDAINAAGKDGLAAAAALQEQLKQLDAELIAQQRKTAEELRRLNQEKQAALIGTGMAGGQGGGVSGAIPLGGTQSMFEQVGSGIATPQPGSGVTGGPYTAIRVPPGASPPPGAIPTDEPNIWAVMGGQAVQRPSIPITGARPAVTGSGDSGGGTGALSIGARPPTITRPPTPQAPFIIGQPQLGMTRGGGGPQAPPPTQQGQAPININVSLAMQTFQPTRQQAQQIVDQHLLPAIQQSINRGQLRPTPANLGR
jgi:TP901 family phage tail tape measure protein